MQFQDYPLSLFGPQYANSTLKVKGMVRDPAHEHWIPRVKQGYFWQGECLNVMINFLGSCWGRAGGGDDGLHLIGPHGSGKTSLPAQVCARLNVPLISETAHARMEIPDLISTMQLIDGKTVVQDGPLTMALRHGYPFLLNEIDYLDPGTAGKLNDIIENQFVILPGKNELVRAAKGFAFMCTSNTNGGGDETGLHVGTQVQNIALMDRLQKMYIDYMSKEDELQMLSQLFTKTPSALLEAYVEVANLIRGQFKEDRLPVTMSSRALIRWIRLTGEYTKNAVKLAKNNSTPALFAMDLTLTAGANATVRTAIHQFVTQKLGGPDPAVVAAAAATA